MYRFGDTDDNLCVEKIHIGQFSILIIKKKKKINRNEYEKSLRRVVISRGAKQFNVWTDFTSKEGKKKKKKRRSVCANKSILAFPFSRVSSSPSLEFSIYHSLPLYLSFRLLSVPLALPLARSSLYFVLLSHFLSLSTSRFLLRTRTYVPPPS